MKQEWAHLHHHPTHTGADGNVVNVYLDMNQSDSAGTNLDLEMAKDENGNNTSDYSSS